ncbi:MAG: hypothetical protein ACJAVI_000210 [Candidatus Azotimanducaceae bacterium]|jgi:hypothetical protein
MTYLNDKVGQMSGENTRAKELVALAISEAKISHPQCVQIL